MPDSDELPQPQSSPFSSSSSYVTHREMDLFRKDLDALRKAERVADQEALRLAREQLTKALADTNNFREEAREDKAKYAETSYVDAQMAKLEQALRADYNKEIQSLSSKVTAV